MTVVLGLAAAVLYGIGDFAGGIASRHRGAVTVLVWSYPVGAALMALLLPLFPGHLSAHVAVFGVLGGVAGVVGVLVMYSLMTVAPINVVSPVTAVLAAIIPVLVGVGLGERPQVSAWMGIGLGIGAVLLVSRTAEDNPHGRVTARVFALACLSGVGFGLYFVLLARAGNGSGLWPLLVSRVASAALIMPVAKARGAFAPIRGRLLAIVLVTGLCDAGANLFFLLAARHGLLSLASVLTSLYPAVTVLLAVSVLREHTNAVQRVGLGLAAAAVVLITV